MADPHPGKQDIMLEPSEGARGQSFPGDEGGGNLVWKPGGRGCFFGDSSGIWGNHEMQTRATVRPGITWNRNPSSDRRGERRRASQSGGRSPPPPTCECPFFEMARPIFAEERTAAYQYTPEMSPDINGLVGPTSRILQCPDIQREDRYPPPTGKKGKGVPSG